jgi:hypothetical protein
LERGVGQSAGFDFESGLQGLIDRGRAVLKGQWQIESFGAPTPGGFYNRAQDLNQVCALYIDLLSDPEDRLISTTKARAILESVQENLAGSHGFRRYINDANWAAYLQEPTYKDDRDLEVRKQMNRCSPEQRFAGGFIQGSEPNWTLGPAIVSAVFGRFARESLEACIAAFEEGDLVAAFAGNNQARHDLAHEVHYFNQTMGAITGEDSQLGAYTFPESYQLVKTGRFLENHTEILRWKENPLPLNWSKANALMAFKELRRNLESVEMIRNAASIAPLIAQSAAIKFKRARTNPDRRAGSRHKGAQRAHQKRLAERRSARDLNVIHSVTLPSNDP